MSDGYYASVASLGDRVALSQPMGRATMPLGWERYRRFHPDEVIVWVDDAEGHPRGLTPKQYAVLTLALEMIEGPMLTMRAMSERLGVAPSTVSRALTRLSAWGLIAYIVGRGRWAGLVIIRRVPGDRFEYLRKAAKARVRGWYLAAQRRISRLAVNVAPYLIDGEGYLSNRRYSLGTSKDATLTLQRSWTAEEIAESLA